MENVNISVLISLVIGFITLGAYVYVTRIQLYEVLLPKDGLTKLRKFILAILLFSIFGLIPVLVYQTLRLYGIESEVLRNIASVAGRVSQLATAVLLIFIYEYKKED